MTTSGRNTAANPQGNNLHMYHRYKHQRATKHLIDLYEANCTDYLAVDEQVSKATDAISQLKSINSRLRDLNRESNLPEDVGVIDYGSFLYGWNLVNDRNVSNDKLEIFCRHKRYMKGWSKRPPTHDYEYFTTPTRTCRGNWNVLTGWLQLIWCLLKQNRYLDLIDELEGKLFEYIRNLYSILDGIELPEGFDALGILLSLHKMRNILITDFIKESPEDLVIEYEKEREQLRCMCEFQGIPCEWVPDSLAMEKEW